MKKILKQVLRGAGYQLSPYAKPVSFTQLLPFTPDVILDIGANVGAFSAQIHKDFPLATIHAFEPIEECAAHIQADFVHHTALGREKSSKVLTVSPFSESSSFLKMLPRHVAMAPHSKGGVDRTVEINTLDSFGIQGEHIFIKSDTQGFEGAVIDGGQETFKRAQAVMIETLFEDLYEGQSSFDDIYSKLKTLGFYYAGNLGGKKGPDGKLLFEDSLYLKVPSTR